MSDFDRFGVRRTRLPSYEHPRTWYGWAWTVLVTTGYGAAVLWAAYLTVMTYAHSRH
jgi:hypothetical protein